MDANGVMDEMRAFLDVLRKGELSEIDLDALAGCIGDALHTMEQIDDQARSCHLLRDDVVSEITRLTHAAAVLADGSTAFDAAGLKDKLAGCGTEELLRTRKNARAGYARLLRSGEMPRKTAAPGYSISSLDDYRTENPQT
jgi:hypothetical protein